MECEDLDQASTFSDEANKAQNTYAQGYPDQLQNQEVAVLEFESRNNKLGSRVGLVQNAESEVMPAYRMKRCGLPRPSAWRETGSKKGYKSEYSPVIKLHALRNHLSA